MGNAQSNAEMAKQIGQIADGVKILTEMSNKNGEQLALSLEEYKRTELKMHDCISNYDTLLEQHQKTKDPTMLVTPLAIAHARLMMTAAIYAFECAGKTHDTSNGRCASICHPIQRIASRLLRI
jgi:hypothetical protein